MSEILSAEEVDECIHAGITPSNVRVLAAQARLRAHDEALRAALVAAERGRDERDAMQGPEFRHYLTLKAEVVSLRKALAKYGQHLSLVCDWAWDRAEGVVPRRPCTCGLDAALSAPKEDRCPTCGSGYRPLIVPEDRPWGACSNPWHSTPKEGADG